MYKIMIWGTGAVACRILNECSAVLGEYEIEGFIDNNPQKEGQIFRDKPIYSAKILETVKLDKIVVLTNAYCEIYKQISDTYPQFKEKIENKFFFYKESILRRYKATTDEEIMAVLDYIKKNGLSNYNYEFTQKYEQLDVSVYYDITNGLYYVIHFGKRLYFSRKYDTEEKVREYYRWILMEQDEKSPHRYLTKDFEVSEGSIVADVGVAEGNFALEVVERVSKMYLIEADESWIEALNATFKNYSNKVVIIKGFVTSYNEGEFCTLDSIIPSPVNFIKMDVEGNEWDALLGAQKIIQNTADLKLAVCAYHSDFDQELIESFMDKNQISHTTTNGYMWFGLRVRQSRISTRLNRGIVRGIKSQRKNRE